MPFFLVFFHLSSILLIIQIYRDSTNVRLYLTLLLIFTLLIVAFIFGSQNEQILTLNYLIAQTQMTVAAAVSIFTALGFIIGILVTILWRLIRRSKKILANKKSLES